MGGTERYYNNVVDFDSNRVDLDTLVVYILYVRWMVEQEIWDVFDHDNGSHISLTKTSVDTYEISVTTSFGHGCEAIKKLDCKHLKDLFNELGNELDAWTTHSTPIKNER